MFREHLYRLFPLKGPFISDQMILVCNPTYSRKWLLSASEGMAFFYRRVRKHRGTDKTDRGSNEKRRGDGIACCGTDIPDHGNVTGECEIVINGCRTDTGCRECDIV